MKKFFQTIILASVSLLSLTACNFSSIFDSSESEDNSSVFVYRELSNGTISISAGKAANKETSLTIPAEYDGKIVSEIAKDGFKNLSRLESVHITKNKDLTTIGSGAFSGCKALNRVAIPDTIKRIGDLAFAGNSGDLLVFCGVEESPSGYSTNFNKEWYYGVSKTFYGMDDYLDAEGYCFGIKLDETLSLCKYYGNASHLEIPLAYNQKKITDINQYAFKNSKVKSVVLSDSIKSIAPFAFYESKLLEYAFIPSTVLKIGKAAFLSNAENLIIFTETVEDPSGYHQGDTLPPITSNGPWNYSASLTLRGFSGFTETEKFVFAHSVKGEEWVARYIGEERQVSVPASFNNYKVTNIAPSAFKNQNRITQVSLPGTITRIGVEAFSGCSSLNTINFNSDNSTPASSLRFEDNCFEKTGFDSFIAPANLSYLGKFVFYNTLFDTLTFDGTKNQWSSIDKDSKWKNGSQINKIKIASSNETINL